MPYKTNPKQYEAVIGLPADQRYQHFIGRVADWEEMWSLKNADGWVGLANDEGQECIPLWPHPDYAAALATGDWADCSPVRIGLDAFLNRWVEGMNEDSVHVAVFPNLDERGVVVPPDRLKSDLEAELEKFGDR